MTERRALVLVDGDLQETPDGDSLYGAGSGAALINTDGDPGTDIYVGQTAPGGSPAVGDVWIRLP